VPVEHLRLLCSLAVGRAETILTTLHNTPFTDMNDSEGEVQSAGYAAFDTMERMLTLLTGFMEAITIDESRTRAHIAESCITITEVADTLVREEGISFRQAHEIASVLAKRMIARRETLETLPFQAFIEAFAETIGRPATIDEARFRFISSPEHFVAVRTMFGGPGALAASLTGYRTALAELTQARQTIEASIAIAEATRARLVAAAMA
jgi:argininosuccinate lyase